MPRSSRSSRASRLPTRTGNVVRVLPASDANPMSRIPRIVAREIRPLRHIALRFMSLCGNCHGCCPFHPDAPGGLIVRRVRRSCDGCFRREIEIRRELGISGYEVEGSVVRVSRRQNIESRLRCLQPAEIFDGTDAEQDVAVEERLVDFDGGRPARRALLEMI